MKIAKWLCAILIPVSLVYFYSGYSLPLEFTVLAVKEAWILFLVFCAFILLVLQTSQSTDYYKNYRSALKLVAAFLLVLHHAAVGGYMLLVTDFYKDQVVYYVDPHDPDHRKIEQRPVGLDSDARFIEAYDLGPFLRYIHSYDAERYY